MKLERIVSLFKDYNRFDNNICVDIKNKLEDLKPFVERDLSNFLDYKIRFDYFKGQTNKMPIVPFFSFFIKDSNWKHTHGYYVVFLFDSLLEKVYLSLVYGTENMRKTDIDKLSSSLRNMLNLDRADINLKSKSLRPKKYESSTLFCYEYSIRNFSDEFKIDHLRSIFDLYYAIFKNSIFIDIIDMEQTMIKQVDYLKGKNGRSYTFEDKDKKFTYEDIKKANNVKKQVGNAGELFILTVENVSLVQQGIKKKAKHISIKNENAGFDILSYMKRDDKIEEKYIEVKTSIKSDKSFYMSKGELDFMRRNFDNYYIYLVREFNMLNQKGKLTVLHKHEIESYEFVPIKFYAK